MISFLSFNCHCYGRNFSYGIQLLPLTVISEQRDSVEWMKEMLPDFSTSCLSKQFPYTPSLFPGNLNDCGAVGTYGFKSRGSEHASLGQ
jgi:hypothetical protein